MFTTICILLFVYTLLGKPTRHLVERLREVDWSEKFDKLLELIRTYAKKAGRVAVKPILTFYFAMQDESLSTLDRCLIYGAIAYVVIPSDFLPTQVLGWLGLLDDAAALTFIYNKLEDKITPAVELQVNELLDEWFGPEYEWV